MNEFEVAELWEKEKEAYKAWGEFVKREIERSISEIKGEGFIRFPTQFRVKTEQSLIDKAFYRGEKAYEQPYQEIDDKVGVRFIALLVEDVEFISDVVKKGDWECVECRHFKKERAKAPLLFTYQSVHFVLRPKHGVDYGVGDMPLGVACEVQVRTVLQHAHAELTHDGVYKSKKMVDPDVHRTVAKSIALIETADDFFSEVTGKLSLGLAESSSLSSDLDSLYKDKVGYSPIKQKSSIVIWDAFERFIDENTFVDIVRTVERNEFLLEVVRDRYSSNILYRQSCIFFVFWLVKKKTQRCVQDWPIDTRFLEMVASDLGVSLDE